MYGLCVTIPVTQAPKTRRKGSAIFRAMSAFFFCTLRDEGPWNIWKSPYAHVLVASQICMTVIQRNQWVIGLAKFIISRAHTTCNERKQFAAIRLVMWLQMKAINNGSINGEPDDPQQASFLRFRVTRSNASVDPTSHYIHSWIY